MYIFLPREAGPKGISTKGVSMKGLNPSLSCSWSLSWMPVLWMSFGPSWGQEIHPKKSTQNKCSSEQVPLNNFCWVPDYCHRGVSKSSRELFKKARVNAVGFDISGLWVVFWDTIKESKGSNINFQGFIPFFEPWRWWSDWTRNDAGVVERWLVDTWTECRIKPRLVWL